METPVTPKPMPTSLPNLPTNHTGKLFGIVYITLTGVMDTIIPAAGPWSWVGKSASYLLKLAPILWWALPARNPAQVIPKNNGLAARDWIPDKPKRLITDGSSKLVGHVMKAYCAKNALQHIVTTLYHPQANEHVKWLTGSTDCQALTKAPQHHMD
ncbi:hypothetical protein DSO57_1028519 [Entomophthora muscae]|uniref:Uncharacterized protein n=1 Tax=Entomophthora muscae TaxID=34485 RepID=A0ACC2SEU3_9FUNG|nr:hypothetical protein DSO57_1028519 [Entomophthora muscae]